MNQHQQNHRLRTNSSLSSGGGGGGGGGLGGLNAFYQRQTFTLQSQANSSSPAQDVHLTKMA